MKFYKELLKNENKEISEIFDKIKTLYNPTRLELLDELFYRSLEIFCYI